MKQFKKIVIKFSMLALFGITSTNVFANNLATNKKTESYSFLPENYQNLSYKNTFCYKEAGEKYNLDPVLLQSIAKVESQEYHNVMSQNRDGSQNLGIYQINEIWKKELAKYNVKYSDLLDPCLSIHFGANLLNKYREETPEEWKYVGRFNSSNEKRQKAYYKKIMKAKNEILKKQGY